MLNPALIGQFTTNLGSFPCFPLNFTVFTSLVMLFTWFTFNYAQYPYIHANSPLFALIFPLLGAFIGELGYFTSIPCAYLYFPPVLPLVSSLFTATCNKNKPAAGVRGPLGPTIGGYSSQKKLCPGISHDNNSFFTQECSSFINNSPLLPPVSPYFRLRLRFFPANMLFYKLNKALTPKFFVYGPLLLIISV